MRAHQLTVARRRRSLFVGVRPALPSPGAARTLAGMRPHARRVDWRSFAVAGAGCGMSANTLAEAGARVVVAGPDDALMPPPPSADGSPS